MSDKEHHQIKKLKKKYEEKYSETLEFILNDETEKAENNFNWLELSRKVIKAKENKFLPPLIIGLSGLLLLSFSFLPVATTQVYVTLETNFMAMILAENSSGIDLKCKELGINPVSNIEWEFRNWNETQLEEAILSVIGEDDVKLAIKELHRPATLTFNTNNDILDIYLDNDSIIGTVVVKEGRLIVDKLEVDTSIHSFIPAAVTFQAKGLGTPIQFEATGSKDLQASGLVVQKLNFNRPISSGEFESGILSGTIVFPATGNEYTLNPGNVVDVEFNNNTPITVKFLGDRLQLEFEGNASKLYTGPKMFTRSLKPSWLDYFHKNEKIAFYGTAIIWLWGMLWSFKKTIFE
jgi:hypothetical protein